MLTSSVVDHGFEHLCGQTKYNILTSSVVDHGFEHLCGQTKYNMLTSSVVDHGFEHLCGQTIIQHAHLECGRSWVQALV